MTHTGRMRAWDPVAEAWVPALVDATGRLVLDQALGGSGPAFSDAFSLGVKVADTLVAPTDASSYAFGIAVAENIAALGSETTKLGFPAPNFGDTSTAPADARAVVLRAWLSGGVATANGVTNVANSNGSNDAATAGISSTAAGVASPSITSALGAGVSAGISVTSAIYRGWFRSVNVLTTGKGELIMQSIGALFTDKLMFANAALNTTIDHLTGTFTYDLVTNGVDTLARLQSCQMLHRTTDAVAGVSPSVLTIDAGCIEIAGAFT